MRQHDLVEPKHRLTRNVAYHVASRRAVRRFVVADGSVDGGEKGFKLGVERWSFGGFLVSEVTM